MDALEVTGKVEWEIPLLRGLDSSFMLWSTRAAIAAQALSASRGRCVVDSTTLSREPQSITWEYRYVLDLGPNVSRAKAERLENEMDGMLLTELEAFASTLRMVHGGHVDVTTKADPDNLKEWAMRDSA